MANAYTYELRSIECARCGAPVVTAVDQSHAPCPYCKTQNQVVPRRRDAREAPPAENARLAALRAQVGHQDPDSPYLFRAPDGVAHFARMLADAQARPAALSALRQEWNQARAEVARDAGRAETNHLFRAGLLLARFYQASGEDERARAVLETALGLVPEPGQRDVLRCWLARFALQSGDEQAFERWFGEANGRSLHLEVDSAVRCTHAVFLLRRGRWQEVLQTLGRRAGDVPISVDHLVMAHALRAHSYVQGGDEAAARQEIEAVLEGEADRAEMARVVFSATPGPAAGLAQVVAREAALPSRAPLPRAVAVAPAVGAGVDRALQKTARRSVGGALGIFGCTSFLPVALILVPFLAPSLLFQSCGMGAVEGSVLEYARSCEQSRALLGSNIGVTQGFSCGNFEISGSSGDVTWRLPVAGSRASGAVDLYATKSGNTWTLHRAILSADGETVDLLQCAGTGGGSLGLPSGGGLPSGLPAAAQLLAQRCESQDADSCYALGTMYQHGVGGVPSDRDRARQYYRQACTLGKEIACRISL